MNNRHLVLLYLLLLLHHFSSPKTKKKNKNLSNSPTPRKNPNKPNNGPFGIAYELNTSACANMDFYVSSIYSLKQSQFFEFQQCATPPTITASRRKKKPRTHKRNNNKSVRFSCSEICNFVCANEKSTWAD